MKNIIRDEWGKTIPVRWCIQRPNFIRIKLLYKLLLGKSLTVPGSLNVVFNQTPVVRKSQMFEK